MFCEATWLCGRDPCVVDASRRIADSEADDSLRMCAIDFLGLVLSSSGAVEISTFLANLIISATNPLEVRKRGIGALARQFGTVGENFDRFLSVPFPR